MFSQVTKLHHLLITCPALSTHPHLFEIPYVPEPKYPEYLAPSDDEAPLEDLPLPAGASPMATSLDYMTDSDPEEDPEEDPEKDPEEDPEEDPEDDQADYPADGGDGYFYVRILLLCYRATEIRMRALLPCTSRRTDIPEADMPPLKRACLTTPSLGFEIRESSAAGTTRQPGPTESDLRRCRVEQAGYGITDTWDEIVDKMMEIAPTTLEGVNERVTELNTIVRQRTNEFEEFSHSSPCQDFRDTGCCTDYLGYVTIDPVNYDTWTHRGIRG
nr:hypothetical protein [Tanacetum cinerariifolium]